MIKAHSSLKRLLGCLSSIEAASEQSRFLGTAAAQEIPSSGRTRKRVSTHERKAMVEAYVDKYRGMNAGKFPTAKNVQGQIGGCYYKTKAIIQELEYSSKLPNVATAANKSTIPQIAQVNWISDAKATPDCPLSDKDKWTAAVGECGISAECYPSCKVDKNSGQKMVDMSTFNKNDEITAEYASGDERKVDLKLRGKCDRASADMDTSDNSRFLKNHILPGISSVVENTLASETLITAMGDSECPAKPVHPSEVTGTSGKPNLEIDEASGQAFESDELTRVTNIGKFSSEIESKKQVSNVDSATIEELDTSMVGNEVNKIFEVEKTMDCQVRVGRTVTVDDFQITAEDDSSSQKEVDNHHCQRMIDTSIIIKSKEVAEDGCSSEKTAAMIVKAIATEDFEYFVKPNHPIEDPKTLRNTKIGDLDDASADASKCDEISRLTTTQQPGEVQSSLWGSLKFFASNVICRWRKT